MANYRWARVQASAGSAGSGGRDKSRGELLLQYGVAPLLTAALGFLAGLGIEAKKDTSNAEQLLRTQRVKVWISASDHFAGYLNNWSRLRSLAEYGEKQGGLTSVERDRRESYVKGRREARDALSSDLDQARLFFSDNVAEAIDEFDAFTDKYRVARLAQLPPMSEYEKRKNEVLKRMKKEVIRL